MPDVTEVCFGFGRCVVMAEFNPQVTQVFPHHCRSGALCFGILCSCEDLPGQLLKFVGNLFGFLFLKN